MPSISFLKNLGVLLTGWLLLCCGAGAAENGRILMVTEAVSYTHLTLPTILRV